MKVIITGISGFVGRHLVEHLSEVSGLEVHGVRRPEAKHEKSPWTHRCDLTDAKAVFELLQTVRPERIVHLAGQSSVPMSWQAPADTIEGNLLPQLNLFQAMRQGALMASFLVALSAEEYGKVKDSEIPVKEDCRLRPVSPYGVSKVAQDLLAERYAKRHGLAVVRVRSFNQVGPGQDERFVISDFARQTALIEAGREKPVIRVGNLEAIRDFTDVRDAARAMWLALEKGASGDVYNICSGQGRPIAEALAVLKRLSRVPFSVKTDPAKLRQTEIPVMVGDPAKFYRQTGWKPLIPFERTVADVLEDWREKIAVSQFSRKN